MNQPDITTILKDSNLSDDAKNMVSLLFPVLVHMEQLSNELNNIIDISSDAKLIKDILINDVIEGKSDKGIVGDITKIKNIVNLSNKAKEERLHTFEDLIRSIHTDSDEKFKELIDDVKKCKNEILDAITTKTPWYKTVSHVKDVIITLSIITVVVLNIMKIFGII